MAERLFNAVFSECGLVGALLFAGLLYQTWRAGRAESRLEASHQAWMKESEVRAAAFNSMSVTLAEIKTALGFLRP